MKIVIESAICSGLNFQHRDERISMIDPVPSLFLSSNPNTGIKDVLVFFQNSVKITFPALAPILLFYVSLSIRFISHSTQWHCEYFLPNASATIT